MSEFEELFQSIQNSVTVDVVRDSAIVLVNEGDAEHPLKAGEYYFDDEKNILYVGSGGIESTVLYITNFIIRKTSFKLIEPPRIKSKITFNIPSISTYTNYNVLEPHRIYLNKIHTAPIIKTYTVANKTNKIDITDRHNIALPIISFESEVVKL